MAFTEALHVMKLVRFFLHRVEPRRGQVQEMFVARQAKQLMHEAVVAEDPATFFTQHLHHAEEPKTFLEKMTLENVGAIFLC